MGPEARPRLLYLQVTSIAKMWSNTSRVGLFLASPSGLRMKKSIWIAGGPECVPDPR